MPRRRDTFRNLWTLTVLCLLLERPMHPYVMQGLIRERKKDEFLDLKRGSLYHAIERLRVEGLIEPAETLREGRRPERTVYRITEAGIDEVRTWLRELLAQPVHEPSQFYAAISFIAHLTPDDVVAQLTDRARKLAAQLAASDEALTALVHHIGRLVLLEAEYTRALRQRELEWVRALIDDIRSGRLSWDPATLFGQHNREP